jgi:hypothetical protein
MNSKALLHGIGVGQGRWYKIEHENLNKMAEEKIPLGLKTGCHGYALAMYLNRYS